MRRRRVGIALAAFLPLAFGASAASLTPDGAGNVVVEAFGAKMIFIARESERIPLSFPRSGCDAKVMQTLNNVARSEVMACVANAEVERDADAKGPDVMARPPVDVAGQYTIYSPATPGMSTQRLHEPLLRAAEFPGLAIMVRADGGFRRCDSESGEVVALGYRRREVEMGLRTLQFSLSAARRGEEFSQPACVGCFPLVSSAASDARWACSATEVSSDGRLSVSFRWLTSAEPQPGADWALFDAFARDVAGKMFPGRPRNDFQ